MVKNSAIYFDKTQHVNFQGNPLFQATKQHLSNKKMRCRILVCFWLTYCVGFCLEECWHVRMIVWGSEKKLSKLWHRLSLLVFVSATCSPGLFFNATLVQCVQCPVGTYQALSGQRACNACPDQKTTLSAGRTSSSDCICESSWFSACHLKPEVFLYCLYNTHKIMWICVVMNVCLTCFCFLECVCVCVRACVRACVCFKFWMRLGEQTLHDDSFHWASHSHTSLVIMILFQSHVGVNG